jgi:Luciferase-like monooxygenase
MKIRFGVGLGADTAPDQLAPIIDHLETSGVDSLWFSELVYSPAVDPVVGMAYALARTARLKVGTSVAILPASSGASGQAIGIAGGRRAQAGSSRVRTAFGHCG